MKKPTPSQKIRQKRKIKLAEKRAKRFKRVHREQYIYSRTEIRGDDTGE